MLHRLFLLVLVPTTCLLDPALCAAQQDSESESTASADEAEAQAQYDLGLQAFSNEELERACAHFQRSYDLDPLPGVLFTLATCETRAGRLATGAEHFRKFLTMVEELPDERRAKQAARVESARAELEKIESEVPHLRIQVHTDKGAEWALLINGEPLDPQKLEQRLALDPGQYVLSLQVDGALAEERRVFLRARDDVTVGLGRPAPKRANDRAAVPADDAESPRRERWMWAMAGVAGVGAGVGSVFGLFAVSGKSRISDSCNGPICENDPALKDARTAKRWANGSTIAFTVAGAAAGGALLFYLNPIPRDRNGSEASIAFGPGSVHLRGRF